ncbi:aminotransferase [Aeromicrobium fastidiosum]|uniref:Aminotransferase n=1 Tax=Aeromicrobium fastidiosum TaxID=52699 RepID=A0A641ARF7_9ACTN|nr:aminotransferase [Aeromicrobium fastidiosum]KAA1380272.1 aminotransferase [Aeromicrobium fastidiosum]MBP2389824.1 4-aminobutyrate aminotransferase-like enzyme/Ser/Thr protein kinase RdoA (MazF antagonist) [Aeromicrobium fastidiosum]
MDPVTTGLPRPAVTVDQAIAFAREHFGVDGTGVELGSQQDRNVLLTTPGGTRYLFKVSNPVFTRAEIEVQNLAMRHLAERGHVTPQPTAALDGAEIVEVDVDGVPHAVRLLTFVPGAPLSSGGAPWPATLARIGQLAGQMTAALADVTHPGLERDLQWDLRQGEAVVAERLHLIEDPTRRESVERALRRVTADLDPVRDALPTQPVHGDLTTDNLVGDRDHEGVLRPTGIIDFGDVMTSWRVAELAVACSAVFRHEPDRPLAILPMVAAFDAEVGLTDDELAALWPLIVLRGTTLVVSGAEQLAVDPNNAYAAAALDDEWAMYEVPAAQDAAVMTAAIRLGLGRPVAEPASPAGIRPLASSLVDGPPAIVRLGHDSDALWDGVWLEDGPAQEEVALGDAVSRAPAAMTLFGEARLTRARANSRDEPTNVALACDLRTASPVTLTAPFDGTVGHRAGALVLTGRDHAVVLRIPSVHGAAGDGDVLAAGDALATTNRATVWLTVPAAVADSLPPAFVRSSELPAWRTRVLDPAPLLGTEPSPAPTRDAVDLLERRTGAYAPLQEHYYAAPPQIERGWREHLVDTTGRHYVDMVNNVSVLGHGHPEVAATAADQWRRLNTNSRFHYAAVAELSERLLATVPDELDTVLLVNSGSEAVDLALRLTRAFSGREDVLCVTESYHGWTVASDAVSTSTSDNPLAEQTRPGWVHTVELPNAYRGTHRGAGAGEAYARDAVAEIERLSRAGTPIGTWIAEPRNGNAGAIGLADGFLAPVFEAIRAGGGICISDEVQVGYGRQGEWFWGYEEHGVVPDVITMAKAMGNGHPLGAVITRAEIAQALADQGTFFSSSGGSTLSSRIGATVLDVIERDGLQENARIVGAHLKSEVERLAERHPLIGTVHGRGLYLGIELVRDRETLEPAPDETAALCDRMLQLGVVVLPTGDRQNVLKVKPPLCMSRDSVDFFVARLDEALGG